MDVLYKLIYQDLSLQAAGIIAGVLVLAGHLVGLLKPVGIKKFLTAAPRSQNLGMWLLTVSLLLSFVVASAMDLGDFAKMRWIAQLALPIMFVGLLFFCNDYLGARASGILALVGSCPLLTAAKLTSATGQFLLPLLAYVWIIFGLFWVGMPHTMRDQINWATATEGRWKILCLAGIAYGAALLACSFLFYGKAS